MQVSGTEADMGPDEVASPVVVGDGAVGAGAHHGGIAGGLPKSFFPFRVFERVDGAKHEEEVRLRGPSSRCFPEGGGATGLVDEH